MNMYFIVPERESEIIEAAKKDEEIDSRRQKNSTKKARQFDLEAMFQEARKGALVRTAETKADGEENEDEHEKETFSKSLSRMQLHSDRKSHDVCLFICINCLKD